ncbi:hypothetical protein [Mycobacterium avium]|uniref:hypothetical protein n=1 Tax=Mycobacterium avium TaxID=1764 RepID=UPI000BB01600|nr:hypothetical protein [Mycobacterium avium]MBX9978446.1 hypothetical protein [Mycobacterium gordonae]PBA03616.1 hypothetical protein CKJ73_24625 [Mycobacterium avium]
MSIGWEHVRAVADAVLYEGYLLYPYRASSSKNQSRWQFGVLGPQRAAERGIGEDDTMSAQLLLEPGPDAALTVVVRFLQLQRRTVERDLGDGGFEPVDELVAGARSWLTWDEAVECELPFGPFSAAQLAAAQTLAISVAASTDIEAVPGGRLVRTRCELNGELTVAAEPDGGLLRVSLTVRNTGAPVADKESAIAVSLIGTHLIASVTDGEFVSLLEPPESAVDAVRRCVRHRCFPVLAGPPGERGVSLVSPIILYDHPEIAEQSEGALYDSTEIDEILTLRVMTMTDEEKAQARATDPLAAAVIDRCDSMSPEAMLNLHGVLRDPRAMSEGTGLIPEIPDGVDWWDPLADKAVRPDVDAVLVNGVRVGRGSRVRLHPSRRADAQDLFFAGRTARVTSVHEDVDGDQHIGVVLDDDPAADLHEWYGRYLYFAPDEVEPLRERDSICK